jgi:hypothetical protein
MSELENNDDGGETTTTWRDGLDLDDSTAAWAGKYESVADAAKAGASAEKLIGGSIRLPKDDASDEDKATAYNDIALKMGKPETSAGYEFAKPENMPEGLQWSDEFASNFAEFAHSKNFTKAQAQDAMKYYHDFRAQEVTALRDSMDKQAHEATEAIKTEMGDDKYQDYIKGSQKAIDYLDDKVNGVSELFDKFGLNNNPLIIKMLNTVYQDKIAEATLVTGQASSSNKGGMMSDSFYAEPTQPNY